MSLTINALARVFPQVRQMQRDTIRIKSEREEWRQRFTSLQARTDATEPAPRFSPAGDFHFDERFQRAFAAATQAVGDPADQEWRVHVSLWAAEQAQRIPGDYVACGAQRGVIGRAVLDYLDWDQLTKTLYLVGAAPELCDSFAGSSNVRAIRGELPLALYDVGAMEIACLFVSMHSPRAEAAGEALWPRVTAGGGLTVLLDFTESDHASQRRAWEQFAQDQGVPILTLPTGQGIMVKP